MRRELQHQDQAATAAIVEIQLVARRIKDVQVPVFHVNEESSDEVFLLPARRSEAKRETRWNIGAEALCNSQFSIKLSTPVSCNKLRGRAKGNEGMRRTRLASLRLVSQRRAARPRELRTRRRRRRMAASSRSRCRTFAIIVVEPDINPCGKRVAHFARASV